MDRYLVDQGLFPRSKKSTTKRKSHVVFLGNGKGKNKKAKTKAGPQGRATGAKEQAAGVRYQRGRLEIPLNVESAGASIRMQSGGLPCGRSVGVLQLGNISGSSLVPGQATQLGNIRGSSLVPGQVTQLGNIRGSSMVPGQVTQLGNISGSSLVPGQVTQLGNIRGSSLVPGQATQLGNISGLSLAPRQATQLGNISVPSLAPVQGVRAATRRLKTVVGRAAGSAPGNLTKFIISPGQVTSSAAPVRLMIGTANVRMASPANAPPAVSAAGPDTLTLTSAQAQKACSFRRRIVTRSPPGQQAKKPGAQADANRSQPSAYAQSSPSAASKSRKGLTAKKGARIQVDVTAECHAKLKHISVTIGKEMGETLEYLCDRFSNSMDAPAEVAKVADPAAPAAEVADQDRVAVDVAGDASAPTGSRGRPTIGVALPR